MYFLKNSEESYSRTSWDRKRNALRMKNLHCKMEKLHNGKTETRQNRAFEFFFTLT
jgi:uncharacterized protein (DUF1919 family)